VTRSLCDGWLLVELALAASIAGAAYLLAGARAACYTGAGEEAGSDAGGGAAVLPRRGD